MAPYVPQGTSRSEILGLKRKAVLSFYVRPAIFLRNLMGLLSGAHFLFLWRRFYRWMLMPPTPQAAAK